ncbi:hypothetical protein [Streptomyces pseudovenezuelae]|uniref:hypothetical protein n=1 Tax=Streptomyces pseudovenezuelae TaxID=67350 RepID=UPI0036DFCA36
MTSTPSAWDALQQRLDARGKPTRTLALCDDPDIRDRYQSARLAAERADTFLASLPKDADKEARTQLTKEAAQAHADLEAARTEYEAHTVTLTFTALEREALEALQAKHPATEEDEERGTDFHFDTFAPALISAASIDGMPMEYAANAMRTWSLADSDDLWAAAWSVQRAKRTDLGKG